jgi:peroxiredoxin Q/BCP
MNFSAHVKFVTKELEKMQNPNAPEDTAHDFGGEQDEENPAHLSESDMAEREELGRVAKAVSA